MHAINIIYVIIINTFATETTVLSALIKISVFIDDMQKQKGGIKMYKIEFIS